MHRGGYAWITTVCYWSLLLIEKQLNEHSPRRHTMHQRVPADKCSRGLTRGKIGGWWTPESSQGRSIDLLISSLDKRCENNDALNAWAGMARILGDWAGKAMQEGEFSSGTGLEVEKPICGFLSWRQDVISIEHCWHPPRPYTVSQEGSAHLDPEICKVTVPFTEQAFINKWKGNLNWWPLQPHKCNFPKEYLKIKKNEKISIFT